MPGRRVSAVRGSCGSAAGDRVEQQRGVADGLRERAERVLPLGDRDDAVAAPQPGASAGCRRRRSGVAGEMIEPSLSEPIVSAARPAAAATPEPRAASRPGRVEVVRVEHLAAERAVAALLAVGDVGGELGQVDLAEDHRARRLAACATIVASLSGTECSSTIARRRRRHPGDVDVVLQQDRQPFERASDGVGPRRARSRRRRASLSASGLSVRTALSAGPRRLTAAMRSM